ncbi:MAG: ABC transporter substrate-binding protein [Alphaproteobacteria bacterium]|jgi:putative hydroxymethylpyrimidine transport system substrate-binding protein
MKTLLAPMLGAILALSGFVQSASAERVTILLDWFINPDHGPLFVAEELGLFAEQGLDVELIEPADPSAPPRLVAAGQAELAISYQPQLHIQVSEGLPLVRVATLVATPLNTVVALADGPVQSLADLKGRKVGFSVGGFEDALLGAMLAPEGLSLSDLELINVNFSLSPSLYSGQVDAVVGAFRNFELNQMDIAGRPGIAFYPEEHGVPGYDELILVAAQDGLDNPALPRVITAIEAATQYMVNNPQAAWELFIKGREELLDNELNRRAWRDTLPRFALRPAAMDTGRYARFEAFLLDQGLIDKTVPVAEYAVQLD